MSAAEGRHLSLIHALRCVVCWNCYGLAKNADEAHHLEFVRGEHSDFATVPLCQECHEGMHERRRRSFYLAHKLNDVKLMAWTVKLIEDHMDLRGMKMGRKAA